MSHWRGLFLSLGVCMLITCTAAAGASAGLVGQWNIDEGSGGFVGAQVGTIGGSFFPGGMVNWGTGGPPKTILPDETEITPSHHLEFDLDGDNDSFDYVDMPDPSGVLSPGAITVGFWTRASDTEFDNEGKVLLSKWSDTDGFSWEFGFGLKSISAGNLFFRVKPTDGDQQFTGQAGDGFSSDDFNDGEWHHVVGTYDGTDTGFACLYVDGELTGKAAVSGNLASGAAPMRIGQRPYSDPWRVPFKGHVGGSLVVFDHALTHEEVADLGGFEYIPYVPPEPELVGRWDLNEVTGGTSTPTVLGSQDGQINGNMTFASGGPPKTILPDGTEIVVDNHFVCGGAVGDNINLGSGEELSPGEITVSFWAKATGDHTGSVLLGKHSRTRSSWEFGVGNSGNLWFRTFTDSGNQFAGTSAADPFDAADFNDGQWHHFAGTHDGETSSFYVDGELIESLENIGLLVDTTDVTDLLVGQRSYSDVESPFNGLIGGPVLVFQLRADRRRGGRPDRGRYDAVGGRSGRRRIRRQRRFGHRSKLLGTKRSSRGSRPGRSVRRRHGR